MKCEYCGNTIPDGVKFCPACGAAVPTQASNDAESAENESPVEESSECKWSAFMARTIFLGPTGLAWFYIGRKRIGTAVALFNALLFVALLIFSIMFSRAVAEDRKLIESWEETARNYIYSFNLGQAQHGSFSGHHDRGGHQVSCRTMLTGPQEFLRRLNADGSSWPTPHRYDTSNPEYPQFASGRLHFGSYRNNLTMAFFFAFPTGIVCTAIIGTWLLQLIAAFFIKKDAEGKILR